MDGRYASSCGTASPAWMRIERVCWEDVDISFSDARSYAAGNWSRCRRAPAWMGDRTISGGGTDSWGRTRARLTS